MGIYGLMLALAGGIIAVFALFWAKRRKKR
jgi:LPXTG-motif cell wall-anchored protein